MGTVDRRGATRLIRRAVDQGVAFLDTAEAYGDTESLLGEALKEGYRDKVYLATKVSRDFSREGVRRAAEASLRALQTDRIDLYQLHRYDPSVPLQETLEEVARLQEEGLIRHIGVSNFDNRRLAEAVKIAPIITNQINYNALNRAPEKEHLQFCKEQGVRIIGHSSLAKGLLTGKYEQGHRFSPEDERSQFEDYTGDALAYYLAAVEDITAVAQKWGITTVQASLAWVLAREEVASVLVGPKKEKQLNESIRATEALSPDGRAHLREELDRILDRHKLPPLCPSPNQLV